MRAIKFRAWEKDAEVKGGGTMWPVREIDFDRAKAYVGLHEQDFDALALMQFTGLTDKNGREIYEGDIMRSKNSVVQIIWADKGYSDAVGFAATNAKHGNEMNIHHFVRHGEVIGNIHENPNLVV